ncbi:hypothetical protein Hanom_Chr16g01513121 [Helianthus anomalus]
MGLISVACLLASVDVDLSIKEEELCLGTDLLTLYTLVALSPSFYTKTNNILKYIIRI